MEQVILKPAFILSAEDRSFLLSLPSNMPDISLTRSQINRVSDIYYRYISKNQVYKAWGTELYKMEQSEKWPSGPRVKLHEAQRFILGWLLKENDHPITDYKGATIRFFSALTGREANSILLTKIYEIK